MAWKWQLTMPGMTVRPARSTTRSSGRRPPGSAVLHRGDPVALDHHRRPLEHGAVADHHPGAVEDQPAAVAGHRLSPRATGRRSGMSRMWASNPVIRDTCSAMKADS